MNEQTLTQKETTRKPVITIATVTYNAVDTLPCTLQSVAEQDYSRIEHVIIDGRSRDHTLGVIQQYVEQNTVALTPHNIRLVCEPDNGLYDAMNKAIAQATGEYIVFLNAGDRLHDKHTISHIVECADWIKGDYANPAILYGETDLVDLQGTFIRHRRLKAPKTLTWKSFQNGMLVCHQSFYVRTDLAREVRYDLRYRFSADFDWCIRVMKRAQKRRLKLVNTEAILTDYLSEGMTTQNHKKSLVERLHIMVEHYGWPTTLACHAWFVIRGIIKR